MAKKGKTKEQKEKRKLKRKQKREAKRKGTNIQIKLPGKGDYGARTRVLRGKGDFTDTLAKAAGDGIRKGVSWLTDKATSLLGGLFGSGDYNTHNEHPSQNSLWTAAAVPTQVQSTKDRAFVYRGREQLLEFVSSDDPEGVQVSFDVNPGLEDFLEWLSITAPGFSEWYPNGLVFEWIPAVSPQAPNSNGKVAMCVSYDNGDPDPASFRAMSQYQMSVQFPPYQAALMAGECAPRQTALNWFKVRTGDVAVSDAAHSIYDWGKLHIRCGGQATAGTVLGTVFVIYEIVFQKPLAPLPVGRTLTDVFNGTGGSGAAVFGTARTARTGNTLNGSFSTNSVYVFPSWVNSGKFQFTLEMSGGAVTLAAPVVSLVNATLLNWMPSGSGGWVIPLDGVSSAVWSADLVFEVTGPSATVTFGSGTVPTGAAITLIITALDTDVTVLNRKKHHYEAYWKERDEAKLAELKFVDEKVSDMEEVLYQRLAKEFKMYHAIKYDAPEKLEMLEPPRVRPTRRKMGPVEQKTGDESDDGSIVSIPSRTKSSER